MRGRSVRWFRTRNSSKLLSARPRAFDSTLLSELRIEIAFQRRVTTEYTWAAKPSRWLSLHANLELFPDLQGFRRLSSDHLSGNKAVLSDNRSNKAR